MAQQYSAKQLKEIGKQCGNRLAPASSVQAMVLYEMQRETEVESLFHGAMFQFARAKESQESRMSELSKDFKALQEEVAAKDVEKRLSMVKIRVDALQLGLSEKSQEMKIQGERLVSLEERTKNAKSTIDRPPTPDVAVLVKKLEYQSAYFDDVKNELSALNEDVTLLFEERNAVGNLLDEMKARTEEVAKETHSELIESISKVHELISKIEKGADEHGKRAEEPAKDLISTMRESLRAEETARQQCLDRISKLTERVSSLSEKSKQHNIELTLSTEKQLVAAEQRIYSRILDVEQRVNVSIKCMEQKSNLNVDNVKQQCKEQSDVAHQKSDLLVGEVGKYKWLAEIEKEKINLISNSVNVMDERITKTDEQVWELNAIFRAREMEQNDRIAKLEDLVRALTAQSPNESSTSSQLLQVRTPGGQCLDLSVPKGRPLVPYKKENINTFTQGKQWMSSSVQVPE